VVLAARPTSGSAKCASQARHVFARGTHDRPAYGDIELLLSVLHRLVDEGNTVIVIEHNLSVIAEADYIVDLGPEAGTEGGEVVACGRRNKLQRIASAAPRFFAESIELVTRLQSTVILSGAKDLTSKCAARRAASVVHHRLGGPSLCSG